eukprot:TRINITY_DN3109_c0_g1_i1.p1 TRINITY_DN3109_c0_g1~~TRINITY_DN3109_c0_g1_i1.p1  ORF type:complete len:472 (-),score=114.96 TRINITY_DN3109_c0_g1_i1:150-1565(-)
MIRCPGTVNGKKCLLLVEDEVVLRLLDDDLQSRKRFQQSIVQSFVEDNACLKWCPAPDCKNVVKYEALHEQNEAVTCKCGLSFCFNCLSVEHKPCTCEMLKEWNKKNSGTDQALDHQLIATISRECPKCRVPVQKNGGCNHMVCSRCTYHFCWQCMDKFGSGPLGGTDGYHDHKCNSFYQDDASVLQKKEEFKRFEWYSTRFNNHAKSFELENGYLKDADQILTKLVVHGVSWIGTQFYLNGINQLLKNRHTLKNSYIFGYFRPYHCPKVNKEIFENLQVELERHTEHLSSLLRERYNILLQKQTEIVNQTSIADNVLKGLIDAAREWYEPDHGATEKKQRKGKENTNSKKKTEKQTKPSLTTSNTSTSSSTAASQSTSESVSQRSKRKLETEQKQNSPSDKKVVKKARGKAKGKVKSEKAKKSEKKSEKKKEESDEEEEEQQSETAPPDVLDLTTDDYDLQLALHASLFN